MTEYDEGQAKTYGAKRDTRPVPQLPKGYRVVEKWGDSYELCFLANPKNNHWDLVATIDEDGDLLIDDRTDSKHLPALAAFLQGAR